MAYGMRIWGADGALQLDENSFTIRVALSVLVSFAASKGSQDFAVPGVSPGNGAAFVVPIGAYDDSQMQFETEMLNGVVRVYNYTRTFSASTVASGTMRLIVMRWS